MQIRTPILKAALPLVLLAMLCATLAAVAYAADPAPEEPLAATSSPYDRDGDGCANGMRAARGGPIVCDDPTTDLREYGVDPDDSDPTVGAAGPVHTDRSTPLAGLLPGSGS